MGKSTSSTGKWFDSLLWLGIAAALAALLVPARRQQVVCKSAPEAGLAANVDATGTPRNVLPSAYVHENVQYFPSGHEFILQNEADHMAAQNAPLEAEATVHGPLLAPPKQD